MKKLFLTVLTVLLACCAVFFGGCEDKRMLVAPRQLKIDQDTLQLTWKEVKEADFYEIEINGTIVKKQKMNFYSLEYLDAGDYVIKVKCVGDEIEGILDSDWSLPIEFTKARESGLKYRLSDDKREYYVSGIGSSSEDVVIDDTYRNRPVTKVLERAFVNNEYIKSVKFGSNITEIGIRAFYNCESLESVEFSSSIETISDYAFQGCESLQEIDVPGNVTSIGAYAFYSCKGLNTAKFSQGLQYVGEKAFYQCLNLESVVLPNSVTGVGSTAFGGCKNLKTASLGNSIRYIPTSVFSGCENLSGYDFSENVILISSYAFESCSSITEIKLLGNISQVETGAFFGCTNLETVTIGQNVTTLGGSVFEKTKAQQPKITNKEQQTGTDDGFLYVDNWLVGCSDKKTTTADISSDTVGIADYALYGCTELMQVIIPNNVKYIGIYALSQCSKLTVVQIGDSVEVIRYGAFVSCTALQSVLFTSQCKLEVIESYAFYDCSSLARINPTNSLPKTLKDIGIRAFNETNIFKMAKNVVYVGDWVVGFQGDEAYEINVSEGVRGISQYSFYGVTIVYLTIPYTVEIVNSAAFYEAKVMDVVIEAKQVSNELKGLTYISDYMFYGSEMMYITLPETIQSIGSHAFYKCAYLTDVVFPNSVKTIGDNAFYGSTLQNVTFGEGIEEIADYAFFGSQLGDGELIIPGNVKKIGYKAFSEIADNMVMMPSLSIILEEGVEEIGTHAFSKIKSLNSISLPQTLTTIGDSAFRDGALSKITIPSGVKTIGHYAFRNCSRLKEVNFNEGIESIGSSAFSGCYGLNKLDLPSTLNTIGDYAFRGCSALQCIILGKNLLNLGKSAFHGCANATFYVNHDNKDLWKQNWNSSRRPVFWDCTVFDGYVESITIKDGYYECVEYVKYVGVKDEQGKIIGRIEETIKNLVGAPIRNGYVFAGWTTIKGSKQQHYNLQNLLTAPEGTTLYPVWEEEKFPDVQHQPLN